MSSFFFFCLNTDVRLARQRRIFSGSLPAVCLIALERILKQLLSAFLGLHEDYWYFTGFIQLKQIRS